MTHALELIVVRFYELFLGPCLVDVVFASQGRKVGLVWVADVVVRVATLHLIELRKGALELLLDNLLLTSGKLELEMNWLICLAALSCLVERQG